MLNRKGESKVIVSDDPSGMNRTSITCDPTDKSLYMNPDGPVTYGMN